MEKPDPFSSTLSKLQHRHSFLQKKSLSMILPIKDADTTNSTDPAMSEEGKKEEAIVEPELKVASKKPIMEARSTEEGLPSEKIITNQEPTTNRGNNEN